MHRLPSYWPALLLLSIGCTGAIIDPPQQQPEHAEPVAPADAGAICVSLEDYFRERAWPGVFGPKCSGCHRAGGAAGGTAFVLPDQSATDANLAVLVARANETIEGTSKLLVKPTGGASHGGGAVVIQGDASWEILSSFAALAANPPDCGGAQPPPAVDPMETVLPMDAAALYRQATISLAGRLPTPLEQQRLMVDGDAALDELFGALLAEPGFYGRLREAYNDILLTDAALVDRSTHPAGYLDELSYPDRLWFNAFTIEQGRRQKSDATRMGLTRGPLELIVHVVREGKPFTEILTADYVMANSYAARSYGVFDAADFVNPEDENEFVPIQLPALTSGAATFPHAGVLTSYYWLSRYPSTETNRNRHRARMFYEQFLNVDVMALSPSGADPTEVANLENPVRDAAQCSVCHQLVDPVAGAFQNFDNIGRYRPRDGGWYTDTFPTGFEGTALPQNETPSALKWLAHQAAKDPRFVEAVTSHAFRILFGRPPLGAPDDPAAEDFAARLFAYERQQQMLKAAGEVFVDGGYDFKALLVALMKSPYYRATALSQAPADLKAARLVESLGASQLLTPEKLTRKIEASLSSPWIFRYTQPLLSLDYFRLLYGGIDSSATSVRMTEPNALVAGVATLMANDLACRTVGAELERPADQRRFLVDVTPADLPTDAASEARIRGAIAALHARLLGERVGPDDPEVDATYQLFVDVQAEGAAGIAEGRYVTGLDTHCWQGVSTLKQDPKYTVRAWMAVVSYLLSTYEFLYE